MRVWRSGTALVGSARGLPPLRLPPYKRCIALVGVGGVGGERVADVSAAHTSKVGLLASAEELALPWQCRHGKSHAPRVSSSGHHVLASTQHVFPV